MVRILEFFIRRIKGSDFKLDKEISLNYILGIVISMMVNLIRGNIKSLFIKKKNGMIFIGNRSKLKMKRKIIFGSGINIGSNVIIDALSKNGVILGNNIRIGDYSRILCSGTVRNIGNGIKIGDNFGCGENCFFGAAGGIEIGNDVIMGQSVRFHSENHIFNDINVPIRLQGVTNKGIKIGNDCWIGSGVVFLDGVNVGNGCVIGANTLVNKDIPDNAIAVGSPVKIIKYREEIKND
ncbi:transferase [Clostridium sp. 2-1]|uniref:acyltransferase n=1 Tax=Clostridium TaxID=1485 RepID=UPI000CDAA856|nr:MULTISPECIES: acyltransferase [Clostridium]MBN7573937.1 acyltransferase [Clostridium beijerinckii]MBN7577617.1 acyltransferase [Clostridium beijerinckii]MBN7583687.1 acyltransferase [Clostridium beijerinckii]MBO0519891.1 acyltransferase [Clostridium beijerinckii]POO92777.1 transferase [Clostridium sp. 2-1]